VPFSQGPYTVGSKGISRKAHPASIGDGPLGHKATSASVSTAYVGRKHAREISEGLPGQATDVINGETGLCAEVVHGKYLRSFQGPWASCWGALHTSSA